MPEHPVMTLDRKLELIQTNSSALRNGENLTPEEKRVIDPEDIWEIALIDDLPFEDQKIIGYCFMPFDIKHYNHVQVSIWFKQEGDLLAKRLGREPTEREIIEDARDNRNMERYRLCYLLNFPRKVKFTQKYLTSSNGFDSERDKTDLFLAEAEMLHKHGYPYFEKIANNTLLTDENRAQTPITQPSIDTEQEEARLETIAGDWNCID